MRRTGVVTVLALAVWCGPAKADPGRLKGGEWIVERMAGQAIASFWPNLTFEDGDVGGSTGCNRYGGSYKATARRLTFGPLWSTRRFCPGPGSANERLFLDIMGKARSYVVSGGRLTIKARDGRAIVATR